MANNSEKHMIASITLTDPLNLIVARYPQTLPVLQRFGLDTCCGGALLLSEAAQHHQLNPEELLAALAAVIEVEQP